MKNITRLFPFVAAILLLFPCLSIAQYRFPESQQLKNPAEIRLALEKLNTVGSVLYLAAHPDDENTRLISWLANERKVRTGYLSLTRGDGGQNLIGTEKGEELGLLRTQELLEARKIDGGEQFFTRAKDFGYSKNPEESFDIWDKDKIMADVVWVIRKFRPDVIITRFPTTGEGGHGHHTASAILASEAFELAANPKAFPEQLKYVKTWQAKRVLWNSFSWNRKPNEQSEGEIKVDVGLFNPLLGMSYGEIASIARSKHRCQGFGSRLIRGEVTEYVKNITGDPIDKDILERVNTNWNKFPGGQAINDKINQVIANFDDRNSAKSIPALLEIKSLIKQVNDNHWEPIKSREIDQLIIACAGIYLDAYSTTKEIAPGNNLDITVEAINRSMQSIQLNKVSFTTKKDSILNKELTLNDLLTIKTSIKLPANSPISQPNWLAMGKQTGTYLPKDPLLVDLPENAPSLIALFELSIGGEIIKIQKTLRYKEIDPSVGEVYQPIFVSPPAIFNLPSASVMLINKDNKAINFSIKSLADTGNVTVNISAPDGIKLSWTSKKIKFNKIGELINLQVLVSPVKNYPATGKIKFEVETPTGTYHSAQKTVDYPHINKQVWYPSAEIKFNAIAIAGNSGLIGYIPGAGDDVASCLEELGFTVNMLKEQDILTADLSKFKAIICGIRAYNTNDNMVLYQDKLNDYVKNGGNYIVQYQTNNFLGTLKNNFAPAKLSIGRDRVTVEKAEIRIIDPKNAALTSPNSISKDDFNNWVQERGLYFASEWDAAFTPLFEMNDPGEETAKGSTLVGQFGKGHFIYTGLSFFRQLPDGVPGAYRLLTNFINLEAKSN